MNTRVFAIASGSVGVPLVKKLGAEVVVDGHKDDIAAYRAPVRTQWT